MGINNYLVYIMIHYNPCRTPFSVPSGLRGRRSKRRGIWLRDRARGIREEGTVPFPFPCAPFALLARPESHSHFLVNLPHRLHALCLQCWLTWIFDILILDRLSTITAIPCWWAPIRAKQLSMTATARAIWLCACVRYWPGRGLVYMCPLL